MRAPAKVDAYLRAEGFGFAKPYYLRHNPRLKLDQSWLFATEEAGLVIRAMVFYPVGRSGIGVSPMEIDCLYPDGRSSIEPDRGMLEAFWNPRNTDAIVAGLSSAGVELLSCLCDPDLMTRVYSFLLDPVASLATAPPQFPELCRPWVVRRSTPNRLSGKAAYLTLMGCFDEAIELLAQIPPKLVGAGDRKILADAQARQVVVPPESIAYLRDIGARVT